MTAVPKELSLGFTRCTLMEPYLSSYEYGGFREELTTIRCQATGTVAHRGSSRR